MQNYVRYLIRITKQCEDFSRWSLFLFDPDLYRTYEADATASNGMKQFE
ncbi:hypothetical protein KHA80_15195 [Anaerobacillus sp. HL2]|nr:hypothetical protein KHA80_15195 [Anaerobacillus sp. HL2]